MNFEKLDRARIAAALVAAIFTGGAALYGVYTKSREDTAASYETLAPEINDLKSDVEQLRSENKRLREALTRTGVRVPAEPATAATAPAEVERPATEGRTPARRPRRTPATAATPPDGGPTTAQTPAPPATPPAAPGEQPPAPPAEQPPAEDDPIAGIKKRVPIDFEKAVRVWKDVQDLRKNIPSK